MKTPGPIEPQRGRWGREQQAGFPERATHRALEQQGVALRMARGEAPQHPWGNLQIANQRSARDGVPRRSAQALKRRKMRVPLVPPKPNEFDKLTSIFICRAALGT